MYRGGLNSFFSWLVQTGQWDSNPVDQVSRVRETDRTFDRRALAPEEVAALLAASPIERRAAYALAAFAGLCRSEAGKLEWSDVDMAEGTLTVRAVASKTKRRAVLPLAPSLARILSALFVARGGEALVLPRVPSTPTLRRDLKRAGLEYETDAGRADYHALRVTMGTNLSRAGVSLQQARSLLRHTDVRLTASTYTNLELVDAQAAVESLDRLS